MFGAISNKDLENINNYFSQFIKFISYDKSEFDYTESTGNSKVDALFKQWNEEIRMIDKRNKDDMKVLGEIVLTADKVEQGIYKNRIKSSSDNPTISTLKSTLNKMLDSVQDSNARILRVVSSYTNDDFTDSIKVADHYKDDMKLLMESINVLGNALSKNAKTNFSNGETLEKNANIMTSSMNSLSSKANNQAASLEETAAALEEITSITRNNAQNAAKMAELGQTVKRSVFTGEELASRTASSMDEINQKVNSINEAITVIDQIAFQTNILSLNAAVEAATAGEAGKGFAVVAAEVRNLASRSAEAAREIKHLVQEATVKANDGKTVSSDMIDGYKELNKNISETIHIIEDVSKASKEQMTGIEQINDSVNMLDRVTQENASEANNVKSIANNISLLANDLLNDAKSKKFN
ncbi:methyl-accepting chemotaxis protein [Arcobacter sp. s6]|uniref:methyl-accepting chemotaxis protein n=1 Tax=Arcobacter sp. s6 TaxID=3230363 RepID=UPI0034A056D3